MPVANVRRDGTGNPDPRMTLLRANLAGLASEREAGCRRAIRASTGQHDPDVGDVRARRASHHQAAGRCQKRERVTAGYCRGGIES